MQFFIQKVLLVKRTFTIRFFIFVVFIEDQSETEGKNAIGHVLFKRPRNQIQTNEKDFCHLRKKIEHQEKNRNEKQKLIRKNKRILQ